MIFEKTGLDDDWHNQLDNTGVVCKLTRDLVEAMDGTVSLHSKKDDRVEIRVSLPVHSIEEKDKTGAEMRKMDIDEIPAFNSN